jgi:hypothetical protein
MRDISISSNEYTSVYDNSYAHVTTYSEIIDIRNTCGQTTILCAAGGSCGMTSLINVVACGNCLEITKNTTINTPVLNGGVYWYLTPNVSFGFSPTITINQNVGDTFDPSDANRLSWNLNGDGGWRMGSIYGSNTNCRKYLFKKEFISITTTTTTTTSTSTSTTTTMYTSTSTTTSTSTSTTTTIGNYCIEPVLTFSELASKENPTVKLRSSLIKVSSNAVINCGVANSKTVLWTVNQIDSVNYSFIRNLDLTGNPSASTGELIFSENTLQYGLYEIKFSTRVHFGSNQTVSSLIRTHVRIVPSGISVVSIDKGIKEIRIGSGQGLYLRPAVYSYDLDDLILPSQLNFVYYCKVVQTDSPNQTPDSQIDLETYKINGLEMNKNETCFRSNSTNLYDLVFIKLKIIAKFWMFKRNTDLIRAK